MYGSWNSCQRQTFTMLTMWHGPHHPVHASGWLTQCFTLQPEFLEELERTMALLAFDDHSKSPVGDLLDYSQRQKTASELNSAILATQCQDKDPKLPTMLKMLVWAQVRLLACEWAWPWGITIFSSLTCALGSTGWKVFISKSQKLNDCWAGRSDTYRGSKDKINATILDFYVSLPLFVSYVLTRM